MKDRVRAGQSAPTVSVPSRLFTSHDSNDVMRLSTRHLGIDRGRLVPARSQS
jgi:ABC-type uncharacterized transport system ATPase subunit